MCKKVLVIAFLALLDELNGFGSERERRKRGMIFFYGVTIYTTFELNGCFFA